MVDIFVARQPVLDLNNNLIGYELFYRNGLNNYFDKNMSGNAATSILLMNTYLSFGIETLVGDTNVYLNFDDYLINYGVVELLDKEKVIIEILEDIVPTERLISNIKRLKSQGYIFAIDDYTLSYKYDNIVNLCDIIKVDFKLNSREDIKKISGFLKNKTLLAEKVETLEEFKFAKSLGFVNFQGYYFSKPVIKKTKTFSESVTQYIKIMNELSEEEPNLQKISEFVEVDVSLSYKILKLVNSNSKVKNEVRSIKHAIAMLGLKIFSMWLSLAMVQNIGKTNISELLKYSLLRAKILSSISEKSDFKDYKNELMLIGTLSVIDSLLEMKMEDIMNTLPLSLDIKNTLLYKETKFSDIYMVALEYEKGNFYSAENYTKKINYNPNNLPKDYSESVKWADEMYKELACDNNNIENKQCI